MTEPAGLPSFLEGYPHPVLFLRQGRVCSRNAAAERLGGLPAPGGEVPGFLADLELSGGRAACSCTLAGRLWEADISQYEGGLLAVFLPASDIRLDDEKGRLPILLDQMRQQVNNLSAAAQLLFPELRETGGDKAGQCMAIMNHSYYRLILLLNELETARNLYGERPAFHPAPLDLYGFCLELADQVAPLARRTGVDFQFESEPLTLLTAADAALLRRLLLCLISNALRAAGRDGKAGLRLARRGGLALLTVWDHGPGLAPGAPDQRSPGGGLGLGLPIARRIASLHGGAVVLESRPDQGVRATFSLPLHAPERPGTVRTPRLYDATGGFSPVLVELSDLLPYQAFCYEDLDG